MKKASMRRAAAIVVCAIGLALIVAPAAAGGRQQDRPMKATCLASFVFVAENTLDLQGTCQITHLGLTTWTAVQTLSVVGGVQQIVNDTTYRAANGDLLYGHFVGTGASPDPMSITFTGTETYTDGTGRFEGVSGRAALTGGAAFAGFDPVPFGNGFWTTSGSINY